MLLRVSVAALLVAAFTTSSVRADDRACAVDSDCGEGGACPTGMCVYGADAQNYLRTEAAAPVVAVDSTGTPLTRDQAVALESSGHADVTAGDWTLIGSAGLALMGVASLVSSACTSHPGQNQANYYFSVQPGPGGNLGASAGVTGWF
jgi:hypothetical protein